MLEVRGLSATYGQHPALQDAELSVGESEIVVILGANGAGKSTLLRCIAGICEGKVEGEVLLSGTPLSGLTPDEIVDSGLALVPEGRGIFPDLSVHENLMLGAYTARARAAEKENLERVLSLFPKLRERKTQIARTMSGGEQQMVAIGRAMMSAPSILMLDEPSLGLAPLLCKQLFENLLRVKELGIGILLVEQNARQSLAIADRGYLLENTRITHKDSAANLATDPAVQKAYLGGSVASTTDKPAQKTQDAQPASVENNSVALPGVERFVSPIGEVRRSADQQIGGSIEDIVEQASMASTTNIANRSGAVSSNRNKPVISSSQMKRVVNDIEEAAKNAQKRASTRSTSRSHRSQRIKQTEVPPRTSGANGSTHSLANTGESDGKPVVIEVYKRPLVEVYRRRPSGKFERN